MATQYEILKGIELDGKTRDELVYELETNMDRIRGSISKAWDNNEVVQELLKTALVNSEGQNKYRLAQRRIITESEAILEGNRQRLAEQGGTKLALFASDQHLPYIRVDYLDLLLQLAEFFSDDIAYYSSLNDLFDFERQGKWEQQPDERLEVYTSNIENNYRIARIVTKAISRKAPRALKLAVTGNHDIRILHALRSRNDGYAERLVLEYMNTFKNLGVLQFVNGTEKEPIIQISDGLKWVHGMSAAKMDSTIVKNTIEAAAGSDLTGDEGILYHTVSGHVHRQFVGSHMGVTHANSGCGCSLDPSYLKHASNRWNLGVVMTEFEVAGRGVESTPIRFKRQGNDLVANYKGVPFRTKYDDTMYFTHFTQ